MEDNRTFFKGDQFPTNDEVIEFVHSRTKHGIAKTSAVFEMATSIHEIWQIGDGCPMSVTSIIKKYNEHLEPQRLKYLRASKVSPQDNSLSEFTQKHSRPSTGREPSKRHSTSIFKRVNVQQEDSQTESILKSSADTSNEPNTSKKRKIVLRNDSSVEQKWKVEVGNKIFDIHSEQEKEKAVKEGFAFDEEFLNDQRGLRKYFIDTSRVTNEFLDNEKQRNERASRQQQNYESALGDFSFHYEMDSVSNEVREELIESQSDTSHPEFISAVRTRAAQAHELSSVLSGLTKCSIGTQTEAEFVIPTVSTRSLSLRKPQKTSRRLNPRLLAAGSLVMGVAGVSTKQAIICIKIISNVMFQQEYILPPSLEKEYCKKLKDRKKLAKMKSMNKSSSFPKEIEMTQLAMSEVISSQSSDNVEGDSHSIDVPTPDEEEAPKLDDLSTYFGEEGDPKLDTLDLMDAEGMDNSHDLAKRDLNVMLCSPSTLRTAHHLVSTLGEQQQALEMIENQHVNLIPDGTARQGGWGKMAGAVTKIGDKYRALRLQTLGSENHSSWVSTIVHMLNRLSIASGNDVSKIWSSIMVMVSDMCRVNMNLAADVAQELGCSWKPGQAYCNLHPRLMMSRSIVEVWKKHQAQIGHDKLFPSLEYCNLDASNDSLVKQVLDALMNLGSQRYAERSWNKFHEITEWLKRKGIKNETGPLRDIRFGELEAKCLTGAYHLQHIEQFLQTHTDIRNKLTCFLRSAFPMKDVIMFYWIGAALLGIHIGEPYVNLLMVKKAKMTKLLKIFPQLYLELLNPPNEFTQLENPAIPCLRDAWMDPLDPHDPPYPTTQMQFLINYLQDNDTKCLDLFCKEVSREMATGFKRQKGDIFGFGDGSQPQLNILSQVPEEYLDKIETTSIAVEQFFGEVDQKTNVSGGCQSKNKICDDLIIKHNEDLITKNLIDNNFSLKPMKIIAKELDELQFTFDKKQESLLASGLKDDEVVILSKETQVQRVVRQCKESHGGPIHNVKELEKLVTEKNDEKALASALNLEIRYRKFTCLLKVATNNELFKQQGIDNKLRITHLKQLLTDDTKPKCHATMSDIETLYDVSVSHEAHKALPEIESQGENPVERAEWLLNGCWPPIEGEQVIALLEDDFKVGIVENTFSDYANVRFMAPYDIKGLPNRQNWIVDPDSEIIATPKDSILTLRPILELRKGSTRGNVKFILSNLDLIHQFIEANCTSN